MTLRDYQRRAVNQVIRTWHDGALRVLCVAPTGSGKSVIAAEVVRRARAVDKRVVAVCHRRELVDQLLGHFGDEAGAVCPGFERRDDAPIQVCTVQTMLAGEHRPPADLVVWDESQHLGAMQWRSVLDAYPDARLLGLTATPERADGTPLGDVFQQFVVAAQYSELLEAGHIVPCDVWHPPEQLRTHEQAVSVLDAYRRHGGGGQAFVFCGGVDEALSVTSELNHGGVLSDCIIGESADEDRRDAIDGFKRGMIRALVNVYCLTEGVDVPAAEVCILGRGFGHASTYLQCVGRVLRPAPGKTKATVIDLTGAVLAHGLPTSDREYSLEGTAIQCGAKGRSLRVCLQCGLTFEARPDCPRCGFVPTPKNGMPRIHSVELECAYAAEATADDAKTRELNRLRSVARAKGWSPSWVIREYRSLFGAAPPGYAFDESERRREWESLTEIARQRGYARGYAFARFKAAFGCAPPWGWQ